MPDSQIRVEFVADASNLKAGAAEAASAVEKTGLAAQASGAAAAASTVNYERLESRLAHLTGHVAMHAIPGFSRMGRSIVTVGETAIGVGPLLATMIPIAAIAIGVIAIDHFQEKALKAAEAAREWASEENKLDEEIAKENEHLLGLTQGPLAEAIQKTKDFAKEDNALAAVLKQADAAVTEDSGKWDAFVVSISKAIKSLQDFNVVIAQHFSFMTGNQGITGDWGVIYSEKQYLAEKNRLETTFSKVEDLPKLKEAFESMRKDIVAGEGPDAQIQITALDKSLDAIRKKMEANALHAKGLQTEAEKDAEAHDERMSAIAKAGAETQLKIDEEGLKARTAAAKSAHALLEQVGQTRIAAAEEGPTSLSQIAEAGRVKLAVNSELEASAHSLNEVEQRAALDKADLAIANAARDKDLAEAALGTTQADADKRQKLEADFYNFIALTHAQTNATIASLRDDDLVSTQKYAAEAQKILVETAKQTTAELERLSQESFEKYEQGLRQVEAEEQRALALQLEQNKLRGGLVPGEEKANEAAIYERQVLAQRDLVESLREKLLLTQADRAMRAEVEGEESQGVKLDDKQIAILSGQLSQAEDRWQQYKDRVAELHKELSLNLQEDIQKATTAFNASFVQWVERGGSAMKLLQSFAQSMETSILQYALQRIERWVAAEIMGLFHKKAAMSASQATELAQQKAFSIGMIVIDASMAAALAMATIPPPEDVPAAAAAFAETMSWASAEQGGISEGGATILHKNEMVLPPHISDWVQKAARSDEQGGAREGEGDQFHYHVTVNALDRGGVEDALREHSDVLFSMWRSQMRNRNLF